MKKVEQRKKLNLDNDIQIKSKRNAAMHELLNSKVLLSEHMQLEDKHAEAKRKKRLEWIRE